MNDRLGNGALAGLLVLTLILVGFSLRTREPGSAAPERSVSAAAPTTGVASPSPTPSTPEGPVVFLGDSMAEGKSASAPGKRWTALVAAELGAKEVDLGHARTGYVRVGPKDSCGDEACPNFEGIVSQVVKAKPSTVVVTGGGNDSGLPVKEFSQAVSDTLTALKEALPGAEIFVVNPWWDLRPVPDSLAAQTSAVKAAATQAKVTYLDTGQPLVGKPELMVADGTNPNDAGHAVLAKAVTQAMAVSANG
jgi:lysophospholipase L1-like esterase